MSVIPKQWKPNTGYYKGDYIEHGNSIYIVMYDFESGETFDLLNLFPYKKRHTKIFISHPISGKTDEEVTGIRNETAKKVKEKFGDDIEIIDSFFEDMPHGIKPLWVLGRCIELLSEADIAYFAKDWENSRGCRIEYQCAEEYGIDIIEE